MGYDDWKGRGPEGDEADPADACPICGKRDARGEPCSAACAEAFTGADTERPRQLARCEGARRYPDATEAELHDLGWA